MFYIALIDKFVQFAYRDINRKKIAFRDFRGCEYSHTFGHQPVPVDNGASDEIVDLSTADWCHIGHTASVHSINVDFSIVARTTGVFAASFFPPVVSIQDRFVRDCTVLQSPKSE